MDGLICLRALWDRIAAGAFILGGGLLVLDAGLHARDAVFAANSFSFLTSGGLGGLAALALGCTLLVSAGFHDEWRKLDRIEAALSRPATNAVEGSQGDTPGPPGPPARRAGPARWVRAESDRVAGWALVVGAAAWLAVGARLVTSALYTPKQVTYVISGGLGAMVVLVLGLAVLLAADTRDEEANSTGSMPPWHPRWSPVSRHPMGEPVPRRRAAVVFGAVGLGRPVRRSSPSGGGRQPTRCGSSGRWTGSCWPLSVSASWPAVLTVGGVRRRRRLALRARVVLGRVVVPQTALRPAEVHRNGVERHPLDGRRPAALPSRGLPGPGGDRPGRPDAGAGRLGTRTLSPVRRRGVMPDA